MEDNETRFKEAWVTLIIDIIAWFIGCWITQKLWQLVAVDVFLLPTLTFWQTVGLRLLIDFLFGRFLQNKEGLHYAILEEEDDE